MVKLRSELAFFKLFAFNLHAVSIEEILLDRLKGRLALFLHQSHLNLIFYLSQGFALELIELAKLIHLLDFFVGHRRLRRFAADIKVCKQVVRIKSLDILDRRVARRRGEAPQA